MGIELDSRGTGLDPGEPWGSCLESCGCCHRRKCEPLLLLLLLLPLDLLLLCDPLLQLLLPRDPLLQLLLPRDPLLMLLLPRDPLLLLLPHDPSLQLLLPPRDPLPLLLQDADIAAAPIYITRHRMEVVDFTRAFLDVHASLLMRRYYLSTHASTHTYSHF